MYIYFTLRRPASPGVIPNHADNPIVDIEDFDGKKWVESSTILAWSKVSYNKALTANDVLSYELAPSRHNKDIRVEMKLYVEEIGRWEQDVLAEKDRLTWFYNDFGSFVPSDFCTLDQLKARFKDMCRFLDVRPKSLNKAENRGVYEAFKKSIAKKVCGYGQCFCGYDCGHTNRSPYSPKLIGTNHVCPLARYEVEPDDRGFFARSAEENSLTLADLWTFCACCEHGELQGDNVAQKDFETVCIDCPVKAVIDTITENEAEGRMS